MFRDFLEHLIRTLFTDRVFLITLAGCCLVFAGVYATKHWKTHTDTPDTAPRPAAENTDTEKLTAPDGFPTRGNTPSLRGAPQGQRQAPLQGTLRRETATYTGPAERELTDTQWKRLDELRHHLHYAVQRGEISREESAAILERQRAIAKTEGMSAWEAAQYFDSTASGPRDYVNELIDQALAEAPDDPERLFLWAVRQNYVPEGPNPEREAAYEKLIAMDDLPPKLRSEILDSFAGTIWYYKPEEALRYQQEAAKLSKNSFVEYMGDTYQRLGQYQKALAIYREDYAKTQNWESARQIRAIEEGKPLIEPIQRPVEETPLPTDTETRSPDIFVTRTRGPFDTSAEFPTRTAPEGADVSEFSDADAEAARAQQASARAEQQRAAAAKSFEDFIRSEFPELQEYLDTPPELRKLEDLTKQLPTGNTPTQAPPEANPGDAPDISESRIRSAMQTLKRYGPDETLRRLRATDPRLAREIEKRLKNNREPDSR